MPEAAAQPFVTSQRPSGVASRAATQEPATHWTWQATPNPTIEAGWTTTWPSRLGGSAPSEQNKLGNYYCWNRIYEPSTGRWTTPDPAMSPWSNLWDYSHQDPVSKSDPSGLYVSNMGGALGFLQRLFGKGAKPGYPTHNSITEAALSGSSVPECVQDIVKQHAVAVDDPFSKYSRNRAMHADDIDLLGETVAWLEAVRAAGKNMTACKCLGLLARLAGMAIHTIQDFYHHSNWLFVNPGVRWTESASVGGVQVGSGWAERGSSSRESDWHHDPWGDMTENGDRLPEVPAGFPNRLAFLQAMTLQVVVPHTRGFLNDLFGPAGRFDHCCDCEGNLDTDFYKGTTSMIRECFGNTGLGQFLHSGRGEKKDWRN